MWFKLPAALADLGLIATLWALLKARGMPTKRLLIYAWSPLPVFEFWVSGHNDAIALLFVVLALYAAEKRRWLWSFACWRWRRARRSGPDPLPGFRAEGVAASALVAG
jgi:hypothetical protein